MRYQLKHALLTVLFAMGSVVFAQAGEARVDLADGLNRTNLAVLSANPATLEHWCPDVGGKKANALAEKQSPEVTDDKAGAEKETDDILFEDAFPGFEEPDRRPMTVNKLSGTARFSDAGRDMLEITGSLPSVPTPFNPSQQLVAIEVGGVSAQWLIDENGRGHSAHGMIKLKLKSKGTQGGPIRFHARVKGNWDRQWKDEGVDRALNISREPIAMKVNLTVLGNSYTTTVFPLLSSAAGKAAKISFKKR